MPESLLQLALQVRPPPPSLPYHLHDGMCLWEQTADRQRCLTTAGKGVYNFMAENFSQLFRHSKGKMSVYKEETVLTWWTHQVMGTRGLTSELQGRNKLRGRVELSGPWPVFNLWQCQERCSHTDLAALDTPLLSDNLWPSTATFPLVVLGLVLTSAHLRP